MTSKNLILYFLTFLVFVTIVGRNVQRQMDVMTYQGNFTSEESGPMLLQADINTYSFMQERKLVSSNSEERKKFRYVYKFFEIQPYLLTQNYLHEKLHKYVFVLYHSIILFLTYMVSRLLFYSVYNKKKNIVTEIFISSMFLLLASYLFSTSEILVSERFTLVETLAISIALYASIKEKIGMFVFSLILGVSNRESAMFLAVFYPLLNYQKISKKMIFGLLSIAPIFFMIINFDILSQITLDSLRFNDVLKPITNTQFFIHLIKYIPFLLPLILLIFFLQKKALLFKKIALIVLAYIFIITFGSYLGNMVLLFLFIPFYIVAIGSFLNDKGNHFL